MHCRRMWAKEACGHSPPARWRLILFSLDEAMLQGSSSPNLAMHPAPSLKGEMLAFAAQFSTHCVPGVTTGTKRSDGLSEVSHPLLAASFKPGKIKTAG